jgi:hypothetical protein
MPGILRSSAQVSAGSSFAAASAPFAESPIGA